MTDIADRVAKLLAKAKGTDNANEAEIFAAKAAEMMAEHNLTEEMLRATADDTAPIGSHTYAGRVPDRWRELIAMGCASLYWCKLVKAGRDYSFIGREHNAKVAGAMVDYLIASVKRMEREYSADRSTRNGFRKGAGLRLHSRLMELHKAQLAPAPASGSSDRSLPVVLANEGAAITAYMEQRSYGKARKSRGMQLNNHSAAGAAAADRINLNKQVGSAKAQARLA